MIRLMQKALFSLLILMSSIIYSKGTNIHNANYERTNNEYELKFVAFRVYNESHISKQSAERLDLFKHMHMAIIKDTLIINDDNKIVFSVQQVDSKQFYNRRYGVSNFYAEELNKLGYKGDGNTITFLKPEDYVGKETWTHNYIDMLGLGVVAGKYIFFPCILADNGEENAMLIYEIPQKVKFSNTIDNRGVRSDKGGLKQVARTPFDNFFAGKDKSKDKLRIDTTKVIFDEYHLPKENAKGTIAKVKKIIINGKARPFNEYLSSCVNAIFSLPSYRGYEVFIVSFEYGDSECWEMYVSDKGIINGDTQRMTVYYVWDDWGAEDQNNADYSRIRFQIYPDYTICLIEEKKENGKVKKCRRYYHINSKGRFEKIK